MIWLLICGIGVATYTIRLSFVAFFSKRELPALIRRTLRFVPIAVLSAIIWPQIFLFDLVSCPANRR